MGRENVGVLLGVEVVGSCVGDGNVGRRVGARVGSLLVGGRAIGVAVR